MAFSQQEAVANRVRPIAVSDADRAELDRLHRASSTPAGLSRRVRAVLLHGTRGEKFPLLLPPGAKGDTKWVGNEIRFEGILSRIERAYRRYRQKQVAHSGMEAYLEKVMVEHRCPDCGAKRTG